MKMFKILMKYSDGSSEEQDEVFDSEAEAEDYAGYLCSCYHDGAEILNLSNPGDYPIDEDDDVDYEILEVDV
ncbi:MULTISPECIES: hypothetical protein [Clostridium]|uniref:Uncharacterized protein n=2 Tax=Clostridium TaxID=1485 RepID=A0A381J992_9CLOT|nr:MULTISPECIES: hypothetical protein [Clostridium]MBB6630672.1 hypothetical protein [Clostridium algidicarnis]PPK44970.1 hypothetical protein BD821_12116 [Clostridium algidicarnis DSM 15099]SUY47705.1 Uncharacterised protein [Clostridium putrefaciens]